MGIPHYCKRCFKGLHGNFISDKVLLMSGQNERCHNCARTDEPVVVEYFRFGEHTVTSDGKHVIGSSKHAGINPEYTFFGKEPLYAKKTAD